ncbi:uroporphyrinogen-III C-methyltransferase [Puia sp. P3]|uniref:uroporphyrinogen-III C-methyltransferase n=1 Tax=Puia sp. P3 TaxID=3423952 RepID=UPI003D66444F
MWTRLRGGAVCTPAGAGRFLYPGHQQYAGYGVVGHPLTHRAVSESIWVVTGTKRDGTLSEDLRLALKSKATVVIYMGMKKLAEIAGLYRSEGFGHMPAAIIQHASQPYEKIAVGTAEELQEMAEEQGLSHPALIIIGEAGGTERSHPGKKKVTDQTANTSSRL